MGLADFTPWLCIVRYYSRRFLSFVKRFQVHHKFLHSIYKKIDSLIICHFSRYFLYSLEWFIQMNHPKTLNSPGKINEQNIALCSDSYNCLKTFHSLAIQLVCKLRCMCFSFSCCFNVEAEAWVAYVCYSCYQSKLTSCTIR